MADFADLVVKLELQQAAFQRGMDQASRSLARVQQNAKGAQNSFSGLEKTMADVARAAAAMAAAFAAFKGAEAIATAADKLRSLEGSFTALLGSGQRAGDMMQRMFGIVQRTGVPLDAVGGSLQRLTIAMQALGASNNQIATVAETFIQLGKVGGSSAEETANALQQLGQALASGKLGGDELRTIRESAPLVAEAIAQAFGVTAGKLKELGEQGKLDSASVANALIAAADKASAAFAKLPQGLEQAMNKMTAEATRAAAALDNVAGVTKGMVAVVEFIADLFKRWREELSSFDANNPAKILVQSIADLAKLAAASFVALVFLLEQLIKLTGKWAEQLKALFDFDWKGVEEAQRKWNDQFDRAAASTLRTLQNLLGIQQASGVFGKVEGGDGETGGFPLVKPQKLKPPPGNLGGGGSGKNEAEELRKRGEALDAQVNSQNALNQKLAEYKKLLEAGAIGEVTYARAVEEANRQRWAANDAMRAALDPIFEYNKRVEELDRLLRENVITLETWRLAYDEANKKLTEETTKGKGGDKEKTELEKFTDAFAADIGKGVGQFFEDIISGSKSAEEAFSKMVQSIISDLAKLLAELLAKAAIKTILSSLGLSTPTPTGSGSLFAVAQAPAAPLMLAQAPTFNAARSLAGPLAAPRAEGETTNVGAKAGGQAPWNVTINNNAPGVDVRATPRPDGLEVTIERMRSVIAQDVLRGGNSISRAMEGAYGLGRAR